MKKLNNVSRLYPWKRALYCRSKDKLNESFLGFVLHVFQHYSFLKNIVIQPGCFCYMVHIYFQSKTFLPETIFVSSYIISGLNLETLLLNEGLG